MRAKLITLLVSALLLVSGCGGSTDDIATVNDRAISKDLLSRQMLLTRLSYEVKGLEYPTGADLLDQIEGQAKDDLLSDFILEDMAKSRGIEIDDSKVSENSQALIEAVTSSFSDEESLEALLQEYDFTRQDLFDYLGEVARQKAYIQALYEDVTRGVSVTDDEIQDYYQENIEYYSYGSRSVYMVECAEEDTANSLRQDLTSSDKNLYQLAETSEDARIIAYYRLRDVYYGDYSEDLSNEIFKLQEGDVSPVIKVGNSFYLIQCFSARQGENIPLDKIREEVRQDLIKAKKDALFKEFVEKEQAQYHVKG